MVLLGAGASVDADVPASHSMGRAILSALRAKPETERYARVLSFVAGGLAFREGIRGRDPFEGVNVEELFNAVQMLADRDALDVAPFVGSWHRTVEDLDRESAEPALRRLHEKLYRSIVGSLTRAIGDVGGTTRSSVKKGNIDRAIEQKLRAGRQGVHEDVGRAVEAFIAEIFGAWYGHMQYLPSDGVAFSEELSGILLGLQPRGGRGRLFAEAATAMIGALIELVWITTADRVAYLSPLVRFARSQQRLVVATLNYDNCVELEAAQSDVPCRVGLRQQGDDSGVLELDGDGIILLKLHGSVDWFATRPPVPVPPRGDRMPMPYVMKVPRPAPQWPPAVIFGGQNKLTAEWPFFDLFRIFQSELSQADRLTVVGYSFRDPHVNQCLSQWLNRNKGSQVCVIDPGFQGNHAEYADCLRRVLTAGRLAVIEKPAREGLREVFPE